ncbi:STN domain-containing protein [Xanthocytophaga flava]|uniref:STN domain-containing protein n=1 Tax=Xanthocytophaga flava TaxID=3048013 RepID=UPI0028D50F95|nr:STN domain-containing protein [Xanthocytophaga flavus]MDJ1467754.1 STN domain-containing protein [Xanthocytophaga flavus]
MSLVWKEVSVLIIKAGVLVCLMGCVSLSAYAQNPSSGKRITMTCEKIPVEQALQRLAQQAGVFFVYSLHFVNAKQTVSFSVKNEPVDDVLTRVCDQIGLLYKKQGKHVILKKKAGTPITVAKAQTKKTVSSPTIAKKSPTEKLNPDTARPVIKEITHIATIPVDTQLISVSDSILLSDTLLTLSDTVTTDTLLVLEMPNSSRDSGLSTEDTIKDEADSVLALFLFRNHQPLRRIVTPSRIYNYKPHTSTKRFAHGDDIELFLFGGRMGIDSVTQDSLQTDSLAKSNSIKRNANKSTTDKKVSTRVKRYKRPFEWGIDGSDFIVGVGVTGLYLNDVTNFAAELQVGLRSIFGVFNVGFLNNGMTRYGIGIGGLFPLGNTSKWSVGGEWTSARLHKREEYVKIKNIYSYTNPYIPPYYYTDVELTNWYHRLNLSVRRQIIRNAEIEVSTVFHWLTTRYKKEGREASKYAAINEIDPFFPNELSPNRVLSKKIGDVQSVWVGNPNDFREGGREMLQTRKTKLWLSLQISAYYTFDFSRRR